MAVSLTNVMDFFGLTGLVNNKESASLTREAVKEPPTFNRSISQSLRESAEKHGFTQTEKWEPALLKRRQGEKHPLIKPRNYDFLTVTPTLRANFERYGREMEATNLEEFSMMAKDFLATASRPGVFGYTFLKLSKDVFAVDYQGEIRGIYRRNGLPIAFFKPNFKEMGFGSKEEELETWKKSGREIPPVKMAV